MARNFFGGMEEEWGSDGHGGGGQDGREHGDE